MCGHSIPFKFKSHHLLPFNKTFHKLHLYQLHGIGRLFLLPYPYHIIAYQLICFEIAQSCIIEGGSIPFPFYSQPNVQKSCVISLLSPLPHPSFLSEDLLYLMTKSSPSFSSIRRAVGARYMCSSFSLSVISQYLPSDGPNKIYPQNVPYRITSSTFFLRSFSSLFYNRGYI